MAWTAPKTWASEPLTSTDLNTYVRDNQNHVHDRLGNNEVYVLDEAANFTTTSTSFVDIDATALGRTITTGGGDVLVVFTGTISHSGTASIQFEVNVDGSAYFSEAGLLVWRSGDASYPHPLTIAVVITGLSAGSHTIKLQWKVDSGTATLYGGVPTGVHGQFCVMEK